MVLMNAAKAARHEAAIIVRTNTCGGMKKAGIAPSSGYWYISSWRGMLPRAPQSLPIKCVPNTSVQTQRYGYRATIGGNM